MSTTGSGSAQNPSTSDSSNTGASSSLAWTPCKLDDFPGFECASLQVPLNYQDPTGQKITLALSRKTHTDPDFRGVILSNPGGPGSSGLIMASFAERLPRGIGAKYDWVGIDPRGVGKSQPKLDCIGDQSIVNTLPYTPKDDAQTESWKENSKRIAAACAQGPGKELLPHMHTTDWVKDLEQVRAALGVEKVTYWGSSYGSYLGMVYATMYPERIEKMFLDGVVNPEMDWYALNLEQQKQWPKSFQKFAEWLASKDAQYKMGKDAQSVTKKIQDKLAELRAAPPAAAGSLNPEQILINALKAASYGVGIWEPIAFGLSSYFGSSNIGVLASLSEDNNTNVQSVYLAVSCSEHRWPAWDQTLADAKSSDQLSPMFTWSNTWFNGPCVNWPVPATTQPKISAQNVGFPILMAGETLDGATPFSGALAARKRFPSSALIEGVGGISHSGTLAAGACVQDALFDFFDRGALPPRQPGEAADKACEAIAPTGALGRKELRLFSQLPRR